MIWKHTVGQTNKTIVQLGILLYKFESISEKIGLKLTTKNIVSLVHNNTIDLKKAWKKLDENFNSSYIYVYEQYFHAFNEFYV